MQSARSSRRGYEEKRGAVDWTGKLKLIRRLGMSGNLALENDVRVIHGGLQGAQNQRNSDPGPRFEKRTWGTLRVS